MAKSDSFFIRAIVESNGTTYVQNEIDLGSFVNLGVSKSTLLRIHNISCQVTDVDSVEDPISASGTCRIGHQLTTQSQTSLVTANNKSLISSGSMTLYNGQIAEDGSASADFATAMATHDFDVAPQSFTKGYLVGVDSLFLAVNQSLAISSGNVKVAYVMECTLEPATQANSVALALSQQ
jgi:hypothetical protein